MSSENYLEHLSLRISLMSSMSTQKSSSTTLIADCLPLAYVVKFIILLRCGLKKTIKYLNI